MPAKTSGVSIALRLLARHFGKGSVVVGAPPSARKLSALRKHMNGLPEGVEDLLASADGIAVEGVVRRILSSTEIAATVGGEPRVGTNPFTKQKMVFLPPPPHPHRVPIGEHGTGDADWVLREVPIGAGAVVTSDHETDALELVASSVDSYVHLWAMKLCVNYQRGGTLDLGSLGAKKGPTAWPRRDKAGFYAHDPGAKKLLTNPGFKALLAERKLTAPTGEWRYE